MSNREIIRIEKNKRIRINPELLEKARRFVFPADSYYTFACKVGITKQSYRNIESGKSNTSIDVMARILTVLNEGKKIKTNDLIENWYFIIKPLRDYCLSDFLVWAVHYNTWKRKKVGQIFDPR